MKIPHYSVVYYKKAEDFCCFHHYSVNDENKAIARAVALRAKHPEYNFVYVRDNVTRDPHFGGGVIHFIAE